mmetsp:Transcript_4450/g.6272  ORF Transcript_4450/g.6272 Transcript_4450/m.6272 type:complete len:410 (+) Transcript_4450:16-1245(+)
MTMFNLFFLYSKTIFWTMTLLVVMNENRLFQTCAFIPLTTSTISSPMAFHRSTTTATNRNDQLVSTISSLSSSLSKTEASSSSSESINTNDNDDYDLSLFSPCKINLFLRILRKREDGYHDLASLFQAVGFGDMLHLSLLSTSKEKDSNEEQNEGEQEDIFQCNMEGVPTDKSNLVLRALDLVRSKTNTDHIKFRVNLIKQVPAQAGLGGGSGNAAAAMWGANELLGRPATLEQLVEWSGDLGSDITFFLSEGTAYCTGRGEIMSPIHPPLKDGTKLTIVKPNIGLSTPEVFRALDYDALSQEDPESLLQRFLDDVDEPNNVKSDAYVNDLEQPAFDCLPQLKLLREDLAKVEGFTNVRMSGSGTSIFCMGEPTDLDSFQKEFGSRDDLSIFPTEFISRQEGVWFQAPN